MTQKRRQWHRIFGLALQDYFLESDFEVIVEVDLSLKQQLVDVVLIEQHGKRRPKELCDGLDTLKAHNLVTYKSMRETLNLWAIQELLGHYVNYRKREGLRKVKAEEVGLYAICTRSPKALRRELALEAVRPGVYDGTALGQALRVIVLSETEEKTQNALWALFSAEARRVGWGKEHYRWHDEQWSGILQQLWEFYELEGLDMPYTIEQFKKDYVRAHLDELPANERLQGLAPEERLQGLSAEEVLSQLSPEEIQAYAARLRRKRQRDKS